MKHTIALVVLCLFFGVGCYAPQTIVPPQSNTTIIQQPRERVIIEREKVVVPPPLTHSRMPPNCPPPHYHGSGLRIEIGPSTCSPNHPCGQCPKCKPSIRFGIEIR